MKIIEVPVFNDDGSLKFTMMASPEEAKHLLQFALNFLTSVGMAQQMAIKVADEDEEEYPDLQ